MRTDATSAFTRTPRAEVQQLGTKRSNESGLFEIITVVLRCSSTTV